MTTAEINLEHINLVRKVQDIQDDLQTFKKVLELDRDTVRNDEPLSVPTDEYLDCLIDDITEILNKF